jgi:DNA-directed RNA polymerase specialized sigma24 family protein
VLLPDQVDVRHFYDRWGPMVLRYCQLYLGDLEQAESATGEAFVGLLKGALDPKDEKLPIGLLQLAVEASRRRCAAVDQRNGPQGLESCIRLLPCEQRCVFLLRGTFSLTADEVAEITNTTVDEVNRLWFEALLSLRGLWLKKSLQGDL